MSKINIAIDGYSACGKSSTAKIVAKNLNYTYIDTGAMYRAVTLFCINNNIDINNLDKLSVALDEVSLTFNDKNEILLNQENVSSAIRSVEVNQLVSEVSAISLIRKKMVEQQQKMAEQKGIVMDGRDIGSVVLPNAELKFFMTADIDVRTKRRMKELNLEFNDSSFQEIKDNLLKRDNIDSTRADSPLTKVDDAIVIDTTNITLEEQIDIITQKALELTHL
ncbi:MAG: (d)CMP kinase [Sphingobacteriales bacterium]|nr:MAG: (d)CMP kinase [Sphingobacteriales bacterium]